MEGLARSSAKLYQSYKGKVIDVVLFGSSARGKFRPNDTDIAVILKDTNENELMRLREEFEKTLGKETHLNLILVSTLLANPLFKEIIGSGVSLLDNRPLHRKLGYDAGAIFSFGLAKLSKSRKVLFSYALHGNKGREGILKQLSGRAIGRAVAFVPSEHADEFREFLESWGAGFYMMNVLKS